MAVKKSTKNEKEVKVETPVVEVEESKVETPNEEPKNEEPKEKQEEEQEEQKEQEEIPIERTVEVEEPKKEEDVEDIVVDTEKAKVNFSNKPSGNVKIKMRTDHKCVIAMKKYDLKEGKTYTVPENVKRILNRAGLLSPL